MTDIHNGLRLRTIFYKNMSKHFRRSQIIICNNSTFYIYFFIALVNRITTDKNSVILYSYFVNTIIVEEHLRTLTIENHVRYLSPAVMFNAEN